MSDVQFTYTEYDIPFKTPIKTARGELKSRRGFLVAAHGPQGEIGVGEAAVIPEFGTEGFHSARLFLELLKEHSEVIRIEDLFSDDTESSLQLLDNYKLDPRPAAEFGIDCALLGLKRALESPPQIRAQSMIDCTSPFPVNTLIFGSSADEIMETARQRWSLGYRTQKLKVGVLSADEELRAIRGIRLALPEVDLRLDANCAWNAEQAVEFCSAVDRMSIDYIEDPVDSISGLAKLREKCGIRIAVDELLISRENHIDFSCLDLCDVLVIKPARIGRHATIRAVQQAAHRHGVQTVYTTMFDTSVGIACTLGFMKDMADHRIAHGLDTARLLVSDTLNHHIIPDQGMLYVPDLVSLPGMIREPYRAALKLSS